MENNSTIQNNSADIITLAVEKIKAEFEQFSGDSKAKAVSSYVSRILQDFCQQDERFAEVIYKFKRTLSDCCGEIMKGVSSHISDIDVYRNAVKFYFPNSEVSMNMSIEITGEAPSEEEILKEAEPPKTKQSKSASKPVKAEEKKETAPVKPKQKPVKKKAEDNGCIQLSLF